MTGNYSEPGFKDGEFIFYRERGTILTKGNYLNDEMNGNWFYYDSSNDLRAIFKCKSASDFTPIFLIKNSGDTSFTNGNGKFEFSTLKDFPYIFSALIDCTVEGEIIDSIKNGVFNYNIYAAGQKTNSSETYKNGKFLKGKKQSIAFGIETVDKPLAFLNIGDDNLDRIDRFYHSNLIFGRGGGSDKKVVDFLLNNNVLCY